MKRLIDLIDNHLVTPESEREKLSHWPSEASAIINGQIEGRCLRAQWYRWKGVEPTNRPQAKSVWTWRIGDAFELVVRQALIDLGLGNAQGAKIKWQPPGLEHPVTGKLDNIANLNGDLVGVEVKSTYSYGFRAIKEHGPKMSWLLQQFIYLKALVGSVDEFRTLAFDRETMFRPEYRVFLEETEWGSGVVVTDTLTNQVWRYPDLQAKIISRWRKLEHWLGAESPPPCDFQHEYTATQWEERYQQYLDTSRAKKKQTFKAWRKKKRDGDWQCDPQYCSWANKCRENNGNS